MQSQKEVYDSVLVKYRLLYICIQMYNIFEPLSRGQKAGPDLILDI